MTFLCGEVAASEAQAPPFDADFRWKEIEGYINDLPTPALRRIVAAERWTSGTLWSAEGRCLVGHACDLVPGGTYRGGRLPLVSRCAEVLPVPVQVGGTFDELVDTHGLARVVARVQQLAAERLR